MAVLAKKSGLFMDTSMFKSSFVKHATKTLKTRAKKGAFMVGSMIIRDCLMEKPKVPRKIGDLQASHVVKAHPTSLIVTIGFNKDYAAKMHEAPDTWNFTLPDSGPKYMSTKLVRNKEKYAAFIAELMKAGKI
jgi:hypothetical protein